MIEAFRNAPRVGVGPPGAQLLGQTSHERSRIALYRVEGGFQRRDVRTVGLLHYSIRKALERLALAETVSLQLGVFRNSHLELTASKCLVSVDPAVG
jgi:hypothetical protein